jgi:membrane protease YdiL (CAAX protease family)
MSDAPRWPAWAIPAVLIGAVAVLMVASLPLALGESPGSVLAASVLTLAGLWALLQLVARRAGVRPGLGLRRITPRMTLVVLAFGTAVALVAAGLTALLADVDLDHPGELGGEQAVVTLDLGTLAAVLARAVIGAIALELLLRGFLLPAVAQRAGTPLAVAGVGILGALAGDLDVAPAMAAIGVALCVMRLESGSILPGIALAAAVQAFVLGISFDWSLLESAGLAVPAGAVAYALAWSWDRDPGPS